MNNGGDLSGSLAESLSGSLAENLNHSYPAIPASIPLARHQLTEFAERAGATPERLEGIRLAASEALTNVVLHAYSAGGGRIHLTAAVAGDQLWVLVADDGSGFRVRHDSPGLGTGLAVIALQCQDFSVVKRSSGGTEVRMRFRLNGNDHALSDGSPQNGREVRRMALQSRGSRASASAPASSVFSTTT